MRSVQVLQDAGSRTHKCRSKTRAQRLQIYLIPQAPLLSLTEVLSVLLSVGLHRGTTAKATNEEGDRYVIRTFGRGW